MAAQYYVDNYLTEDYGEAFRERQSRWAQLTAAGSKSGYDKGEASYVSRRNLPKIQRNGS
jgi:hypothetical protein